MTSYPPDDVYWNKKDKRQTKIETFTTQRRSHFNQYQEQRLYKIAHHLEGLSKYLESNIVQLCGEHY